MQAWLQKLFEAIENRPLTLGAWATALLSIITIRIGIENAFDSLPFRFADQFFYQFSHHFLTFTTIFLVALPILAWAGRVELRKAANVLITGFLCIWTPPMVDEIISRGAGLWSFYSFDNLAGLFERYITFFGDKPDVGITYGVRFEVGLVVLLIVLYTWIKSRSVTRTLGAGIALYTALFIVGVLPSIITILLFGPSTGFFAVSEHDIARLMLSPAPLFILNPPDIESVLAIKMSLMYGALIVPLVALIVFFFFRKIFWSLFHNVRFPQIIYHAGLFLVGAGLAGLYGESSFRPDIFHFAALFMLLVAADCAWLASVVVNDLHDIPIDRLTNTHRPLVTGAIDVPTYKAIGFLFFSTSVFFAAIVSTQAALLFVLYQAFAFLYSANPLRLKRYPIVATALAGLASLLILLAGFIVFSTEKNIAALPVSITVFLFFAYLAIIPIKDFKDIAGDRADGVLTLPVLLGETKAKYLIGAFVFVIFAVSPFVFSLRTLFPLGLFFGGIGYWMLQLSSAHHAFLSYQKLSSWFMLLAAGYATFLAFALVQ